jgi:hypothetical protein
MNTPVLSKEMPSKIRRPIAPDDPKLIALRKSLPTELKKSDRSYCKKIADKAGEIGLTDIARTALEAAFSKASGLYDLLQIEVSASQLGLSDLVKRAEDGRARLRQARDRAIAKAEADRRAAGGRKAPHKGRCGFVERLAKVSDHESAPPS